MKRQLITRPVGSNFARSFFLTAFLIAMMSFVASAQALVNPSPDVEIKYVGLLNAKPVFRVEYNAQNRNITELVITDEEGRLLFSDRLNQQSYSKNFQVDADKYENFKLILTLTDTNVDTKEKKRQVFLINGKIDVAPGFGVTKL